MFEKFIRKDRNTIFYINYNKSTIDFKLYLF